MASSVTTDGVVLVPQPLLFPVVSTLNESEAPIASATVWGGGSEQKVGTTIHSGVHGCECCNCVSSPPPLNPTYAEERDVLGASSFSQWLHCSLPFISRCGKTVYVAPHYSWDEEEAGRGMTDRGTAGMEVTAAKGLRGQLQLGL